MGNCYLKTFSSSFSLKTNDCHLGGLLLYLFCAMNLWCSICESSSCSSFLVRSASSVAGAEYKNFHSNNRDKCTISLPSPLLYFFFFALWTRRTISRALHPLTSVNPFPMQSHMDTCNDNESFTCFTFTSTSFVGRTFCIKETQEKPLW